MSYTTCWGFAEKNSARDESDRRCAEIHTGRVLELKLKSSFMLYYEKSTKYVIEICGDWEAASVYILSRYILQSTFKNNKFLAFPSEERQVIIIAAGSDVVHLEDHDRCIKAIISSALSNLGLTLRMRLSDNKLTANSGMDDLPMALLFLFKSKLLDGRWFRIVREGNREAILAAKLPGLEQKLDVDCVDFETLTVSTQMAPPSISAHIYFSTSVHRVLSAHHILKAGHELAHTANGTTFASASARSEAFRENLRRLRSGPHLVGLHDGQFYECVLKTHESCNTSNITYLSSFEQSQRHLGYLRYVPADEQAYALYWHLLCGSGLGRERGFPKTSSASLPIHNINAQQSASSKAVASAGNSQDSLDCSDSEGAQDPPSVCAHNDAEVEFLRLAPVPNSETLLSECRQCATQLLPRALLCSGISEVPFLTRKRSAQIAKDLVDEFQNFDIVDLATLLDVSVDVVPQSLNCVSSSKMCQMIPASALPRQLRGACNPTSVLGD